MLRLSEMQRRMLHGDEGPGARRAMEIVIALARLGGSTDLIAAESAQVAGVSYANLGEHGLRIFYS